MNIKRRIGSLPVISGLVFALGVAVCVVIAMSALQRIDHVGSIDYPYLDHAKAVQAEVRGVTEQFQSAVSEGDKTQIDAVAKVADRARADIAAIEHLPGHEDAGRKLRSGFDAYYTAALDAAHLMLGMTQGDLQKTISSMQGTLSNLTPVLDGTVKEAQDDVSAALARSATEVRSVLWVIVLVAVVVISVLAVTARRTIHAIWNQLGDEPEAISAAARRLAAGEIDTTISAGTVSADSTMAYMAALQNQFKAVISELNSVVDASARGDLTRRVTLEGKEGCYRDIATSVNRWAENSQLALTEVAGSLRAIAQGELPAPSARRLEGEYGQLQSYCDNTVSGLKRLVGELGETVGRAQGGDFSRQIDVQGLRGFQVELASGVNTLIEVTTQGLSDTSAVLAAVANGDLTKKVESTHEGAFGELTAHADSAVSQLSALVARIRQSSEAITRASEEITSGDSSNNAGRASIDQLAATIRTNADSAAQANDLARHASNTAITGKDVVTNVVATMEGITATSNKIADIIRVIDSIAFQTNILALNAAVEAARAGAEGRGFAVVASQVRDLAKRSAESAKEIKQLISQSVEQIESGSLLVTRAGKSMDDICNSVKHVTVFVSEMDQANQHTASLMERISAATRRLQDLASRLLEGVEVFKLADSPEMGAAVKHSRRPIGLRVAAGKR